MWLCILENVYQFCSNSQDMGELTPYFAHTIHEYYLADRMFLHPTKLATPFIKTHLQHWSQDLLLCSVYQAPSYELDGIYGHGPCQSCHVWARYLLLYWFALQVMPSNLYYSEYTFRKSNFIYVWQPTEVGSRQLNTWYWPRSKHMCCWHQSLYATPHIFTYGLWPVCSHLR